MSGRPRILVIDDGALNRSLTARQLARLGFEADLAATAVAALDLLCSRSYAAILVDRHMPGIDGVAFAGLLREREAGGEERTPIVMLTADLPRTGELGPLAREFDAVLVKPVTLAQLAAALPGGAAAAVPLADADPSPAAAREAPIDHRELSRLMGSAEPGLLARVAERFHRAFADQLGALESASAAHDRAGLAAAVHAAKGSAATAAATGLAGLMAQLQALAPDGDWTMIAQGIAAARLELERVRRFAEALSAAAGAAGPQ